MQERSKAVGSASVDRAPVADLAAGYAALESGAADLFITHTGELLTFLAEHESAAAASTSTTEATTTTEAATTTTVTASTTGDATVTPPTGEVTTTTISSEGQAAAISISLQSNQIGEILPETLQIGAPSNAENKNVIVCNGTIASTLIINNLTDLARFSPDMSIAGPAAFETGDPFGLPGFQNKFGSTFKEFVPVEDTKIGDAITPPTTVPESTTTGDSTTTTAVDAETTTTVAAPLDLDAECGAFNSLDVTIPSDAKVLDDDQNWISANGVIPLMTAKTYTPGVSQVIDQVSQALRTSDLRAMMQQVIVDGTAPNIAASNFLGQVGIGG